MEIEDIVNSVPYAIENYLYRVLIKLEHPEEEIKLQKVYHQIKLGASRNDPILSLSIRLLNEKTNNIGKNNRKS